MIFIVALTAFVAQSHSMTGLLVSARNTSDAFKFINGHAHWSEKLVEAARLTNDTETIFPRVLAFAAASGAGLDSDLLTADQNETAAESAVITTADNSAIVKPNYSGNAAFQGNIVIYRVVEGDTLSTIASRFNLSSGAIAQANNLNDLTATKIKPGQELKVPLCDGILYSIKETDTLDSLSEKYKLSEEDVDDFLNCNDVETFEDLQGLKIVVIPQQNLTMPLAPRPKYVRSLRSNSAGRLALTTATAPAGFDGSGSYLWPTPYTRIITQWFSWRHNGIDIAEPGSRNPGSDILATDDCFVEIAGWQSGGWGNTVVCSHGNGLKSRYAHLSTIDVTAGQNVPRGGKLGNIGSTGRSTGPHVHFSVYQDGRAFNPLTLFNR